MSIYAVDFDQTLAIGGYDFPDIGKPNIPLIAFLIQKRKDGHKVVLWSCREGDNLANAVGWCRNMGLEFDAVNDNIPAIIEAYGVNSRKVFADYYIDDKAVKDFRELLPKSNAIPKEVAKRKARIIRR